MHILWGCGYLAAVIKRDNIMARKSISEDRKNIKSVRWEAILKLIAEEEIGTQQDLAASLKAQGYNVTQATVSRDIRELGLVKHASKGGGYRYATAPSGNISKASEKFYSLFAHNVTHIESALNQVVVRTYQGMAGAICAALDSMSWDKILGTVAGDDTILIICRDEAGAHELSRQLRDIKCEN